MNYDYPPYYEQQQYDPYGYQQQT